MQTPPVAETWVPVGTMMNPSLTTDTTAEDVAVAFDVAKIAYVSYGSRGFTISVKASDAAHARDILRTIPNVGVLP